jgi:hypothetical protein
MASWPLLAPVVLGEIGQARLVGHLLQDELRRHPMSRHELSQLADQG